MTSIQCARKPAAEQGAKTLSHTHTRIHTHAHTHTHTNARTHETIATLQNSAQTRLQQLKHMYIVARTHMLEHTNLHIRTYSRTYSHILPHTPTLFFPPRTHARITVAAYGHTCTQAHTSSFQPHTNVHTYTHTQTHSHALAHTLAHINTYYTHLLALTAPQISVHARQQRGSHIRVAPLVQRIQHTCSDGLQP